MGNMQMLLRMKIRILPSLFFFGRPFVKRFALCYQTVVCLSVCNVGVLCQWGPSQSTPKKVAETLRKEVGIDPDDIVLDGDPAPPKGVQRNICVFIFCYNTNF